jgi:hypothetical protein
VCLKLAKNELPEGITGNASELFEEAVADAFEFVFARRVLRLGARLPGRAVSDMVTQTPDGHVLIIDAKASSARFSIGTPELRPLREYADRQRIRQQGGDPLRAAILVAQAFQQDEPRLIELSHQFNADAGMPLSFLDLETMLSMVDLVAQNPRLRNTVRWAHVFCGGGVVSANSIQSEMRASQVEIYRREF